MFKIFKYLFTKPTAKSQKEPKESGGITKEMIYSLRDGIKLSDERNYEAALRKFDIAVETGLFNEAYRERGYCLQILGFHLDSIDDFSRAIELLPQNANNYYGRALSKGSLGNYDEAIADATLAIELSKIESSENLAVNQVAKDKNIIPQTLLYVDYLNELQRRNSQTNETVRQVYINPAIRRK